MKSDSKFLVQYKHTCLLFRIQRARTYSSFADASNSNNCIYALTVTLFTMQMLEGMLKLRVIGVSAFPLTMGCSARGSSK